MGIFKVLKEEGFRKVMQYSFAKKKQDDGSEKESAEKTGAENEAEEVKCDEAFLKILSGLKKGDELPLNAFEIKEGQLLGIVEGKIKAVGDDMQQLICDALEEMDMENAELATLYYGEGVTEDDANQLLAYLEEHYPDVEFELYLGAQAVYSYLISVE